ncbi:hypothetical protein CL656_06950 [bacterium]|nr:hypothetical protein [bacterium]|tara:strand:+ start:3755 stop:4366 length:612 start_codon:yes stop_codon:yes gene_type:complete
MPVSFFEDFQHCGIIDDKNERQGDCSFSTLEGEATLDISESIIKKIYEVNRMIEGLKTLIIDTAEIEGPIYIDPNSSIEKLVFNNTNIDKPFISEGGLKELAFKNSPVSLVDINQELDSLTIEGESQSVLTIKTKFPLNIILKDSNIKEIYIMSRSVVNIHAKFSNLRHIFNIGGEIVLESLGCPNIVGDTDNYITNMNAVIS